MALPLNNSFEGGTNTTAISAANSGGASGNAVDSLVGTAPTFSSTHSAHGSLAMAPTTAAQSMVQWVASFGTPTEFWCRFYLWMTAAPSAAFPVCVARDQANAANASLLRFNSGSLLPQVVSNTTAQAFTSTVPTATWFRLEVHGLVSGGNVTTDAKYFATADAVTATESQTTPAVALTGITSYGAVRFGANLAQTQAIWMDDIQVNSTGFPGPAVPPVPRALVVTARSVAARTRAPQAASR